MIVDQKIGGSIPDPCSPPAEASSGKMPNPNHIYLSVCLGVRAAASEGVRAPGGELTERSSADQREPVELQGPQQGGPQVTLPGGHEGHRVQREGGVPGDTGRP